MGRSVGRHPYSVANAFFTIDEDIGGWFEEDVIEPIQYSLVDRWNSFDAVHGWEDREGRIIAENSHAKVVLYEYCGLCCLSLVPKDDFSYYEDMSGLAEYWCSQIAPKFTELFSSLSPVARFSNGEEVFKEVA